MTRTSTRLMGSRDSRALTVGGTVLLLVLAGRPAYEALARVESRAFERLGAAQALRDTLEQARARYEAARQLSVVQQDSAASAPDSLLVSGDSDVGIRAHLGALLREGASTAGITLSALQFDDPASRRRTPSTSATRRRGRLAVVSARVSGSGSADAAARFLAWIEESPPMLSIRELSLSGGGAPGSDPSIRITMRIDALALTYIQRPDEPRVALPREGNHSAGAQSP